MSETTVMVIILIMGLGTALTIWRVKRLADACCDDVERSRKLDPKAYGLPESNR